eukprot:3791113-Karenia_brevis.AAC.1
MAYLDVDGRPSCMDHLDGQPSLLGLLGWTTCVIWMDANLGRPLLTPPLPPTGVTADHLT